MPDFIDLTLRVRKEKLGDVVADLPAYCQPVRWDVVKEVEVQPRRIPLVGKISTPSLGVPETLNKPLKLGRRRWKALPESIINEIQSLKKDGMKSIAIAKKLHLHPSNVWKTLRNK